MPFCILAVNDIPSDFYMLMRVEMSACIWNIEHTEHNTAADPGGLRVSRPPRPQREGLIDPRVRGKYYGKGQRI